MTTRILFCTQRIGEESTFMGDNSKLSSLVIRPVLLPKLYLSSSVPLILLFTLQLHIAFLIITSPQLFKISHSSMLPAVVFFPNALHLQRKKINLNPTKTSQI